jgi:ElaB/YqjD/DUF883 family membrane-anchored ribosome-binding protein
MGDTARRMADMGREGVERASSYVRDSVDRASEYAQDLTVRAGERIGDLTDRAGHRIADWTGKPPEAWAGDLRQFVEHSPVKALAIAIGVGYVLGRMMHRA